MKKIFLFFGLCCFLMSLLGCEDDDSTFSTHEDDIKIGMVMPITGVIENVGSGARKGAFLAVQEINAAGGVFGKKLYLDVYDNESNKDIARKKATEIVEKNVIGIIGDLASSATLNVANVTIPKNIFLISPASTSPLITTLTDNNLVWRTVPSDAYQGSIAAERMFKQGKKKAVIAYIDNAYGTGLATAFKKKFEAMGGKVERFMQYPELSEAESNVYDYQNIVDSLFLDTNPDLMYIVSYPDDGIRLSLGTKKYLTLYPYLTIHTSDGLYVDDFLSNAEPSFLSRIQGTAPVTIETDPNYVEFKKNFTAYYGHTPTVYSESAYDAVYLIVYAMLYAQSTVSKEIAAHFVEVSQGGEKIGVNQFIEAKKLIAEGKDIDYEGAAGKIDFDVQGDVTSGSYGIWKIEKGKFEVFEVISFSK